MEHDAGVMKNQVLSHDLAETVQNHWIVDENPVMNARKMPQYLEMFRNPECLYGLGHRYGLLQLRGHEYNNLVARCK